MKKILLLPLLLAAGVLTVNANVAGKAKIAQEVIVRTFGSLPECVRFKVTESPAGSLPYYTTQVRSGRLTVEGSSPVAVCKGFHDYILSHGYGVATWSSNRLEMPDKLPDEPLCKVVSPFENHLYMNVCTLGYTAPYWDWERWQREIDWMALHGFDMPLAPVAGEAIMARVWRAMGLSDEEIDVFFTGPGHMPWMRMGNMTGLDGAPTVQWHQAQVALEHRIIDRMQALGMTPVYQGFAGFVPPAMKEHYPEINVTETKWSGFKSWLLSPLDSLFTQIGSRYITEWEHEFGRGRYYLIDSFNEMDIPFGPKGSPERAATLRNYSSTIYNSLHRANHDAIWVMQGWMFGYQPYIWDAHSVEALLDGAPDDRMMIIDLAVDFNQKVWRSEKTWNKFDGLYGKRWIYSTVPNFGGRSALTGELEFYANAHREALQSPNRGRLTGYGTSPEGVENNEVVYEIISAAGWSDTQIDLTDFLDRYSCARYGSAPAGVMNFWQEIIQASYGEFTNNARFLWQLRPYPQRMPSMGVNDHYYKAIENFIDCCDRMKSVEAYRMDAIQYAAFYLAGKADLLLEAINWAYVAGQSRQASVLQERFAKIMTDMDRLLASHPILRLDRWIDMAFEAGATPDEKSRFAHEALRLVTLWGGPSLHDYSARIWSGLIANYYLPRYQRYFEAKADGATVDFGAWEQAWLNTADIRYAEPFTDPLQACIDLVSEYRDIDSTIVVRPDGAIICWSPFELTKAKTRLSCSIPQERMKDVSGIKLVLTGGNDSMRVTKVECVANRKTWASTRSTAVLGLKNPIVELPFDKTPISESLSKEVSVYVSLEGKIAGDCYGYAVLY